MTAVNFCYWLQGYFELNASGSANGLSAARVEMIEKHLRLVFTHDIDPSQGDAAAQAKLNDIHGGEGDIIVRC